jgi:hypothetical protein
MFTTRRITPMFAQGSEAQALATWRQAAGLVRVRWQEFLAAPGPGSRSRTFASYLTALDDEEAAAAALALLSASEIAA